MKLFGAFVIAAVLLTQTSDARNGMFEGSSGAGVGPKIECGDNANTWRWPQCAARPTYDGNICPYGVAFEKGHPICADAPHAPAVSPMGLPYASKPAQRACHYDGRLWASDDGVCVLPRSSEPTVTIDIPSRTLIEFVCPPGYKLAISAASKVKVACVQ